MSCTNDDYPKRIARKFVDQSSFQEIILKETTNVVRISTITMTSFIIFINIKFALSHSISLSIVTLFASLIPYSIGLFIMLKIVPIYANFIQRKKIELYIKKCLAHDRNRIILSFYKYRLFTSLKTDTKIFSTIINANRVIQIENVFIEIYRPYFREGGTSLVFNIIDQTIENQYLEEILNSLKKRNISTEYLP